MNTLELKERSQALLDRVMNLSKGMEYYSGSLDIISEEKWNQDRRDEHRTSLLTQIDELIHNVTTIVEEQERELRSSNLHPDPVWVLGLDKGNKAEFGLSIGDKVQPEDAVTEECVIMHLSKFVETCERVKTMVEGGNYDQIDKAMASILIYREAWKDQISLIKSGPVAKGTIKLRSSNEKKSDSTSKPSGPLRLRDPDKKRSGHLTLIDPDKKEDGD